MAQSVTARPVFPIRLGTRASPLALRQAEMVRDALLAAHGWDAAAVELVPMVASGDKIQDRALADIGGKALWTRELDRAMLAGEIDAAVHSMKDVETLRDAAFQLVAVLPRADVRDRLIGADSLDGLPHGARVGTSSPRRTAQLQRLRPDIIVRLLRGNVATRLSRIADGSHDATLLAAAGLERLGMDVGAPLATDMWLPAPQQGVIGVEAASAAILPLFAPVNHAPTMAALVCERALLAALGGDCRSPIAALAQVRGNRLRLNAQIFSADGSAMVEAVWQGDVADAQNAARDMARDLLARADANVIALFQPCARS
ncbi:MAG: hydroxymethylbilane synthase [Sphingomonadaceae bacterium]|nr:hydroxymethylbilane synthase [Sphingomonadaceae bacterium]